MHERQKFSFSLSDLWKMHNSLGVAVEMITTAINLSYSSAHIYGSGWGIKRLQLYICMPGTIKVNAFLRSLTHR